MEHIALVFGEYFINRNAFHKNKRPISIDEVDIRRIVLSSKHSYGNKGSFKYFIGYIKKNDPFPAPLCIKFSQINEYTKYFDNSNNYMNLLVYYKKLLKKYNEIWDKISNLLKEGLYSEPMHNDKYIKTKITIFNNRA